MTCADCGATADLQLVVADLGEGAFLAVLCPTCWHRRKYRAELELRRNEQRLGHRSKHLVKE